MGNGRVKCIHAKVLIAGNMGIVVDGHGRCVCVLESTAVARLKEVDLWEVAFAKALDRLATRKARLSQSPWDRRIESLACAFRKRLLPVRTGRGGTRRNGIYQTGTWDDACHRMVMQGINKVRRSSATGWGRWAMTVASNSAHRAMAYEQRKHKRHGGRIEEDAQGSGISMPD